MLNFTFHNPVKIVFGKGTIEELSSLVPRGAKVMLTYGGGSIKANGVYDQAMAALRDHSVIEFGGIEANPLYETCMKAVEVARAEEVDFLLSVGGGSVLDATKFIAAALHYEGKEPWDILAEGAEVASAVQLGAVLTLPATGSEMNPNSVISRKSTQEKLYFGSPHVYPQFSILDPETTYSLPERQVANGIVDAFVHVFEQYMTFDVNAPLQDRQAEAILLTLIEEARKLKDDPKDYNTRANIMWCATNALNFSIACGVPQDWTTHMIGHELTAFHGLDHARSLAVVLPALLRHQRRAKGEKLALYARRVWGIEGLGAEETIEAAIVETERFFESLGVPTRLGEHGITRKDCRVVVDQLARRGAKLGEHQSIGEKEVEEILELSL